jgi:hypothetical protein
MSLPSPTTGERSDMAGGVSGAVARTLRAPRGPVARLVDLAAQRRMIDRAIHDEVLKLRDAGLSWTDIGRGLDMTRQGARQRHGCVAVDIDVDQPHVQVRSEAHDHP